MKENHDNFIKVGITQGDINGIGYEVIFKSFLDSRMFDNCIPIIYGSPKTAAYHKKAMNLTMLNLNTIKEADDAQPGKLNVINCNDDNVRVELGKSTEIAGNAAFESLQMATSDILNQKIDVLVTAPINKNNIQSENFKFAGHTEYLMTRANASDSLMLMVGNNLKVGVVTGHLPVNKISENITVNGILGKLRMLNKTLIEDFSIRKPKIAVLGLNPHAGDGGLLGTEERDIIQPAIAKANEEKILAMGPFPADGFFGHGSFAKFDAILAMFHDQGLVPFKLLEFENGVNFTVGIPFIRTSPSHGTAYEIAGKDLASPASFRAALFLACDIFKNRIQYKNLVANAMKPENIKVNLGSEADVEIDFNE